jgi:hypothetical protein
MKRLSVLRWFSSAGVLLILSISFSCDGKHDRSPTIEFEGNASWYKGSDQEKEYLLKTFTSETKKAIPWPPEELARYVDISIDVTESSFTNRILYRGREIPWAEYNVHKFTDYLLKEHVLLPGDRITLRVFGAEPKRQKISQDQSWDIINPPLQIEIESAVYTSRHNDRHLKVMSTTVNYADYERNTVSQIEEWGLDRIRKEIYTKSPLLHHIANVERNTESKTVKRLLIFVTDGYIDFDDVYFSPADYSEPIVEKIKNAVEGLKLRPSSDAEANTSVIIFGLNDRGDERFRQKQESLLRWFFGKQNAVLLRN